MSDQCAATGVRTGRTCATTRPNVVVAVNASTGAAERVIDRNNNNDDDRDDDDDDASRIEIGTPVRLPPPVIVGGYRLAEQSPVAASALCEREIARLPSSPLLAARASPSALTWHAHSWPATANSSHHSTHDVAVARAGITYGAASPANPLAQYSARHHRRTSTASTSAAAAAVVNDRPIGTGRDGPLPWHLPNAHWERQASDDVDAPRRRRRMMSRSAEHCTAVGTDESGDDYNEYCDEDDDDNDDGSASVRARLGNAGGRGRGSSGGGGGGIADRRCASTGSSNDYGNGNGGGGGGGGATASSLSFSHSHQHGDDDDDDDDVDDYIEVFRFVNSAHALGWNVQQQQQGQQQQQQQGQQQQQHESRAYAQCRHYRHRQGDNVASSPSTRTAASTAPTVTNSAAAHRRRLSPVVQRSQPFLPPPPPPPPPFATATSVAAAAPATMSSVVAPSATATSKSKKQKDDRSLALRPPSAHTAESNVHVMQRMCTLFERSRRRTLDHA